jgi:hypothetical protein
MPWLSESGWLNPPSDTTPPIITVNITGTLSNNGWYTDTVTGSWLVVDEESDYTLTGCDKFTVSADTVGDTFTCSALSLGGPSSVIEILKRDATPPSASASAVPQPNGAGWNNSPVTVTFDGSDALSGIAGCDSDVTLSEEGEGMSASGTCRDAAGNVSAASVKNIKIDTTAPVITITTP